MSADDRFVEFVRHAAAELYNVPPETPRDAMWAGIERGWTEAREDAASRIGADPLASAAGLYNAPPETPRDAMWSRIEAAWRLRASAPADAREAGLEPLTPPAETTGGVRTDSTPVTDLRKERSRRTAWPLWIGVAAALMIGIAIGRQSVQRLRESPNGPAVATAPAGTPGTEATDPAGDPTLAADPATDGAGLSADNTIPRDTRLASPGDPAISSPAVGEADSDARRRIRVFAAATFDHLSRTDAFLTSFRASDASAGETSSNDDEMARWARGLLADTRLLLNMPVERDPRFTSLLEELELVLAQIAVLGDNALEGERELIMDGMDDKSTLFRIRAAFAGPAAIQIQGV